MLASALRTDAHCLRRLEPTDAAVVELREWSRLSEDLTPERVRLANRMRQQLWRYYPQFLDAVDNDVAAPWALDLWRRAPTPCGGSRVGEVTLAKLLKEHRIRRIDAATLRARLRAAEVLVSAGTVGAAVAHVQLVAERLALVNRQLDRAHRTLDVLVARLAEPASTDVGAQTGPASTEPREQPSDAAIVLSIPGVGTKVLATLLAEGGEAVRRRDYEALRCLCGVAPVTRRSGKSLVVSRRLAAHERLRDAAYHWARTAAQRDRRSRDKCEVLRARGRPRARSALGRRPAAPCGLRHAARRGPHARPGAPVPHIEEQRTGRASPTGWVGRGRVDEGPVTRPPPQGACGMVGSPQGRSASGRGASAP